MHTRTVARSRAEPEADLHILSLSAYDADSHARFDAELARRLPEHRWTRVALPPRHYAWRAGGSALAFAERVPADRYDLILATGPADLSALLGLRPDLAGARRLIYVHEHEFAFPTTDREQGRVDRQMRQILALLCADRVLVNSSYCGTTLLDGAADLLARMPDAVPPGLPERLADKLRVEPVPLEDELFGDRRQAPEQGVLQIVWNHRHEWDKGPDRLPFMLEKLRAGGVSFRLHLLGRRFRATPAPLREVERFLDAHPEHRGASGFVKGLAAYRAVLAQADLVVSTALQEFQGLSVMEAVALGCRPVVPDRLAYRDWVPSRWRTPSFPEDARADAEALADRILAIARGVMEAPVPDLAHLAWSARAARWRAILADGETEAGASVSGEAGSR